MNPTRLAPLLALFAACSQPVDTSTAVDACALKEYLDECQDEAATPSEQEQCRARAPKEATRPAAGIPPQCRASKAS